MSNLEISDTNCETRVSNTLKLDFNFAIYDALYHDEHATEIAEWNERFAMPAYEDRNVQAADRSVNRVKNNSEKPTSSPARIRTTLGQKATLAFWGAHDKLTERHNRRFARQQERSKTYAVRDDDSRWNRIYKKIRRNQTTVLGAATLGGLLAVDAAFLYMRLNGIETWHTDPLRPYRHYDVKLTANTTNYVFGGFGDPTAAGALGARNGNPDYVGVYYPASIPPASLGPSLDAATNQGARSAYGQIQQQLAQNPNAQITIEGFSEGSIAAAKTQQMVAAANGGTPLSNVRLVLNGSPVSSQGFWNSASAQAVRPFLNLDGISPDTIPLPAGTVVNTSQNDLWGNGGNQTPLGNLAQAVDLGYGHVVRDPNVPQVTWTDSAGVTHNEWDNGVHPFTQLVQQGAGVPVMSGYNDFFNDIVPINGNTPGSGPLPPPPNAAKAEADLAHGISQTMGGNPVPERIMAAVPQPVTTVFQDGLNIANNDGSLIAQAMQDPTKMSAAVQYVTNDVNKILTDISKALPSETNHPIIDFINGAARNNGINLNIQPPAHASAPVATKTFVAPTVPTPSATSVHASLPASVTIASPKLGNTPIVQAANPLHRGLRNGR